MTKHDDAFDIAGYFFQPSAGVLRDPEGREIILRPQTLQVLSILAEESGSLVTKETLMERVWTDTHVTDDSLVQCVSEIRRALGPEAGGLLRTIPRQGYRLDATPGRDAARLGIPVRPLVAAVAAVALLALATLLAAPFPRTAPVPQSIAVLPFENLSGDPDQAYYANGLADELIVDLSKISDLRVVSRGASFAVAGRTGDPRQIAEELGVSHIVEGSVRREGASIRITASLIDGVSGENVWADSYAGAEDKVFDFQDDVVAQLARVLSVRLSPRERERLGVRGTHNVEAFDSYLQGIEFAGFLTASDNLLAEEAFLKAIRLDPDYAAAHAQLSIVLSMQAEYGWTNELSGTIARAAGNAERAVVLDPDLPFAHFALGRLLSRGFVRDIPGASAAFERAIELDPNYTDAYAFLAITQIADGRAEEGLSTIRQAFARNPVPPFWYYMPLGLANFYLGDYEEAEAALTALLERNPNLPNAVRILIATYGYMGRRDDAEWQAMEYETLGLSATIGDIMRAVSVDFPAYREVLEEGLKLAGLPE